MELARFISFSLLICCPQHHDGLLIPTEGQCTVNSTENSCLLERINDLNVRMAQLETKPGSTCPSIAFMATPRSPIFSVQVGHQLRFDNVMLNSGNAYFPNHGNFIPPVSGIYFFTYTVTTTPGFALHIRLKRNGVNIGDLLTAGLPNYLQTTESVVVHLTKNDDIWLEAENVGSHGDIMTGAGIETHFAGFILNCD